MRGVEGGCSGEAGTSNLEATSLSAGETQSAATAVSVYRSMSRSSIRAGTTDATVWDAQHGAGVAFTEVPFSGTPSSWPPEWGQQLGGSYAPTDRAAHRQRPMPLSPKASTRAAAAHRGLGQEPRPTSPSEDLTVDGTFVRVTANTKSSLSDLECSMTSIDQDQGEMVFRIAPSVGGRERAGGGMPVPLLGLSH